MFVVALRSHLREGLFFFSINYLCSLHSIAATLSSRRLSKALVNRKQKWSVPIERPLLQDDKKKGRIDIH